jgi:hypothetical protein
LWNIYRLGPQILGQLGSSSFTTGAILTHAVWYHVALVRTSTELVVYINGTRITSQPLSGPDKTLAFIRIFGATGSYAHTSSFEGNLDDVRITKGIARYTGNFNIPTQAFPDAVETVWSPTAARTVLSLHADQPTEQVDAYAANVVLLLRGDGSTVDSSPNNSAITVTGGNTTTSTDYVWGYGSLQGVSGGYFSAAVGAAGLMAGDFTWEAWVKGGNNSMVFYDASSLAYLYNGSFQGYGGTALALTTNIGDADWVHLAISRVGSTIRSFYNGVLQDSKTYSGTVGLSNLRIGYFPPNNNLHWTGLWDNFKLTAGVGRYTTDFTPDNGRRIVDSSCYQPKTAAFTGLANYGTTRKFGTSSFLVPNTGSATLNGVVVTDHQDFDFDTGDFCFDGWAYRTANTYTGTLFYYTDGTAPISFTVNTSGEVIMNYRSSGGTQASISTGLTFPLNAWQYVVVQRRGTNWEMYLNGAAPYTTAITGGAGSTVNSGGDLFIGRTNASSALGWNGYIDEFRVTKGAARYTNPNVPTAAFPDGSEDPYWANVVALLHFDGGVTDSSLTAATPVNYGASFTSTNAKFVQSLSITGGTTQGVTAPALASYELDGDFTIEGWIRVSGYATSTVGRFCRIASGANIDEYQITAGGNSGVGPQNFSARYPTDATTTTPLGSTTIVLDAWTHLALTRAGNTYTFFVNGVQIETASNSYRRPAGARVVHIGGNVPGSNSFTLTGLYDDFRITKGVARYPSSFTPPTLLNCDSGFGPGGDPTPVPAPPPPAPPQPPAPQPIAFSVVTRPTLFAIIGSALSSTTLATVTCADAAMTISLSEPVAGLTFSYAAKVLTVSGTPTGSTRTQRLVVSYVASDGSNTIRGSSTHTITLVSAAETLTIGAMASAVLRSGTVSTTTLCSPTSNWAADVTIAVTGRTYGMNLVLNWTRGSSSGSGNLVLSGTPYAPGYVGGIVPYPFSNVVSVNYVANGIVIGTSTHTLVLNAPWAALPPAPSPTPAPSPPSPSPPPAPSPAPAPGLGPDSYFSTNKLLLHCDDATGLATDVMGNVATFNGAVSAPGAVGQGASMTGVGSPMRYNVSGIGGVDGNLTVECMVDLGQGAWAELTAAGNGERFCPVVSALARSDGELVWSLGFGSWMVVSAGTGMVSRVVSPVMYQALTADFYARAGIRSMTALGPPITARPVRFVHLAGCRKASGSSTLMGCWFDGQADLNAVTDTLAKLPTTTDFVVQIGGAVGGVQGMPYSTTVQSVVFTGVWDEVRINAAARYADRVLTTMVSLPSDRRVIPWPNY